MTCPSGYEKLGDVSVQSGDIQAASDAYRKFVELSEKLAQDDPNDTESQRTLAVSYERLGLVNLRSGKVEAAHDAYQRFFEISKRSLRDRIPTTLRPNVVWPSRTND